MADWMHWLIAAGVVVILELFTGTFYLLMIAIGIAAGAGRRGAGDADADGRRGWRAGHAAAAPQPLRPSAAARSRLRRRHQHRHRTDRQRAGVAGWHGARDVSGRTVGRGAGARRACQAGDVHDTRSARQSPDRGALTLRIIQLERHDGSFRIRHRQYDVHIIYRDAGLRLQDRQRGAAAARVGGRAARTLSRHARSGAEHRGTVLRPRRLQAYPQGDSARRAAAGLYHATTRNRKSMASCISRSPIRCAPRMDRRTTFPPSRSWRRPRCAASSAAWSSINLRGARPYQHRHRQRDRRIGRQLGRQGAALRDQGPDAAQGNPARDAGADHRRTRKARADRRLGRAQAGADQHRHRRARSVDRPLGGREAGRHQSRAGTGRRHRRAGRCDGGGAARGGRGDPVAGRLGRGQPEGGGAVRERVRAAGQDQQLDHHPGQPGRDERLDRDRDAGREDAKIIKENTMATWAVDAFGNDFALDWAEDLQELNNMDAVEDTLNNALDNGGDNLEAPFAAEALVAIEVIARLQGHWGERTEESAGVDAWVGQRPQKARPDLAEKAHRVIERVLSERSELRQLWADSDDYEAWRASVLELKSRVSV